LFFRQFFIGLLLIGCTNFDKSEISNLNKLSQIEIVTVDEYIPNLIKIKIQKSLNKYNINGLAEKNLKVEINISEKIEGSLLSNSIRKIEMTAKYKIFDSYTNKVVYEDSFSRYSLLGPIDSLFSREQSERNARKRLGISISNDIIIRLIQWAEFSY
tara:strand:+ start:2522 stop:2992 length:471 start_codon:yes stop_codon:yes gene_type:complete